MTPFFDSVSSLLAMGGHGVYVWACWGLVVLVVVFGVWQSKQARTQAIHQIRSRQCHKKTHLKKRSANQGGL